MNCLIDHAVHPATSPTTQKGNCKDACTAMLPEWVDGCNGHEIAGVFLSFFGLGRSE